MLHVSCPKPKQSLLSSSRHGRSRYLVQPHIWCFSPFKNIPKNSRRRYAGGPAAGELAREGPNTVFKMLGSISRQALALALGSSLKRVNSIPEMSPEPHAHGVSAAAVQSLVSVLLVSSPARPAHDFCSGHEALPPAQSPGSLSRSTLCHSFLSSDPWIKLLLTEGYNDLWRPLAHLHFLPTCPWPAVTELFPILGAIVKKYNLSLTRPFRVPAGHSKLLAMPPFSWTDQTSPGRFAASFGIFSH